MCVCVLFFLLTRGRRSCIWVWRRVVCFLILKLYGSNRGKELLGEYSSKDSPNGKTLHPSHFKNKEKAEVFVQMVLCGRMKPETRIYK